MPASRPKSGCGDHAVRDPEHYQYDFNLADITEVWRRGSVMASWLLDLTAICLGRRPLQLSEILRPCVGLREGRWTMQAAIDEVVLQRRCLQARSTEGFSSRGEDDFCRQTFRRRCVMSSVATLEKPA